MNQFRKTILSPVVALLISSSAFADNISYSLEKQSLKDAIEKISKKANKPYITNGAILDGKTANAIKDLKGTQNALDEVLKNSGLEAIIEDGAIIIKPVPSVKVLSNGTYVLDDVSVSGKSSKSGSAENGYLVEDVKTLGVWGNLSLQDTPYSMSIVSSDFIENTITNNIAQVSRQNPLLYDNQQYSANGGIGTKIRGFTVATSLIDGIPILASTAGNSTNEVDRIEVISGTTGFLYGAGRVGGTVNYALKYPTLKPFTKVSVGNNGGENYYASVDISQNITDKLSVRVNGVYQDGDTAIDNYKNKEKLIGISFDYKPTDNLQLQAYYSHMESFFNIRPSWATWLGDFSFLRDRPDASSFDTKKLYAYSGNGQDITSDKVVLKANYNFTENFRLRTAYIYKDATRNSIFTNNLINQNRAVAVEYGDQTNINHGAYAYLDSDFNTGFVHHTLTFGGSLGTEKYTAPNSVSAKEKTNITNLDGYDNWDSIRLKSLGEKKLQRENLNTNLVLGDNITFNDNWSSLVGVNLASMQNKNGQGKKTYDENKLTPTLSLIYKPVEDLTTYVTYIQALENGTEVGNTYANAGEVLDPYLSTQYEIGAKWSVNQDLLLSTALFRIEQANRYIDGQNRFTQDGEQLNEGVEVLATGKVSDSLTLMGGVTYINPKVEKSNLVKVNGVMTNIEGNKSVNVPKYQAKMYAEYKLPVVPKIFLNGGVYYTGTQWENSANTRKLPAYTTLDLGARYETKLDGYDTTFRIYATNLTDEKAWVSNDNLNDPKSVAFNVTLKF